MAKKTTRKTSSKKTSSRSAKATRKPAARKKTAAKKSSTKKPAAKKTQKKASKKTSKKTPSRSTSRSAAGSRKTSKKTTAKKTTAKKTTAKKTSAKKTTAKAATKSPATKKTTAGSSRPARGASSAPRTRIQAPPPRPERRVRPAKFDAKQLAAIKEQLTKERTDLEQQLTEVEEESFTGTQSELSGDAGLNDDFADAGSATFDRENALSIRNNIRDLIDQITRAMGRIDEGTYGTCERCGKPIDAARLKALPHALLCMDCKRREERAR